MDLDIDLLPWQNEVWNSPARWKVVAAGRRTGKSRLAAYLLLYRALQAKRSGLLCCSYFGSSQRYHVAYLA